MNSTRFWASVLACCAMPLVAAAQLPEERAKQALELAEQRCQPEIKTHCKDVTKGDGRIAACLYAHEEKLSARCEYALYDAADELQDAAAELAAIAEACETSLNQYCADVQPGDGRLRQCMKDHDSQLSEECKQALRDEDED